MDIKLDQVSDEPRKLSFELIKHITNNFSEKLGRGAFGQVFKGVLEDGEQIAVKRLNCMPNINEQQFKNEFEILNRLEHPNIVRLVGFCDEAEDDLIEYNGKLTVCQRIHLALCLEYMPNGSLANLLSGDNLGNNWPIRYKIIKGICEGLKYLQEGSQFSILHLDMKPDNILLDEKMMPKISDFGLSRLIGEGNTRNTLSHLGTIGYIPPEFINHQVISKEYDIYSLGVIITKIITGSTGYSIVADMTAQEFVEHVHENWKRCLQEIPEYESLEVFFYCNQVRRCIMIARNCMEIDRHKRPKIKDIVRKLENFEIWKKGQERNLTLQRYSASTGGRVVVGCIPYRVRPCDGELEVLVITFQKEHHMMFPQEGGWLMDESMDEAAHREALKEAGVLGDTEPALGRWLYKSRHYVDQINEGFMLPLRVTAELDQWPEMTSRKRTWAKVQQVMEGCPNWWMREALEQLVAQHAVLLSPLSSSSIGATKRPITACY